MANIDPVFEIEVNSIIDILPMLDYYKLLHVEEKAPDREIKKSFYKEAAKFHPDKFFGLEDKEMADKICLIYKRIAEAYSVLSNPDERAEYDQGLAGPDRENNLRFNKRVNDVRGSGEYDAAESPGKKYWQLAKRAWANRDYKGAKTNINFAISMDSENEHFQKFMAECDTMLEQQKAVKPKGNANSFKIGG